MNFNVLPCADMYVTQLMETWLKADKDERKQLDKDYLAFVREQPCEISGVFEVVPHHYRSNEYSQHGFHCGTGMKMPDIHLCSAILVCPMCKRRAV